MRRFRLGLYDALDHGKPTRLLGRVFRDSAIDRRIIRLTIRYFNRLTPKHDCKPVVLGVFEVTRRGKAVSQ